MNRNATRLLATGALSSLLLVPASRSGGNAPPGSPQKANPTQAAAEATSTVESLLKQRKAIQQRAQQIYRDDLDALTKEACSAPCIPNPGDYVIALVPDPVQTHLALQFDRAIETIEQALQDDDYSFVRAVMPWDQKTHSESTDYEIRLKQRWHEEARQELPGLMAFRADDGSRSLFVLIVGESPTAGIRSIQFTSAIQQIRGGKPGCSPTDQKLQLRILGPTFSGSLSSLAHLLQCDTGPRFAATRLFSGTVSSRFAVGQFLRQALPLKATFASFQEADEVMIERFVQFMNGDAYGHHSIKLSSIALLSEDETAYGRVGRGIPRTLTNAEADPLAKIYFPREISQLRGAYQVDDQRQPAAEAASAPRQVLPLNLAVNGSEGDTVPSFSKQAPLSQEAIMLGIVSELRHHDVRFILLRATDPLDLLFLSRYLGSAYPQGRIVTIGADMLFRRELEDPTLQGILALSTYSLAPIADHRFQHYDTQLHRSERVFPSSSEAGLYNAMRSLIAPATVVDLPAPTCRPLIRSRSPLYLYQYGAPDIPKINAVSRNTPPVHLLALGRDEFWPIAHLGAFEDAKFDSLLPLVVTFDAPSARSWCLNGWSPVQVTKQIGGPADPVVVPISWHLAELVVFFLAIGFALSLWFSSVYSPTQPFAVFAPIFSDVRLYIVAAMGIVLTALVLTFLWPFVPTAPKAVRWQLTDSHSRWLLLVALILVFGSSLWDMLSRNAFSRRVTLRVAARSPLVIAFVVASVILFVGATFAPESPGETLAGIRRLGVLRSLQLTSGLSPILPVFFLLSACLWWMYQIAAGCTLLDMRRPRLPMGLKEPMVKRVGEDDDNRDAQELLRTLRPGRSSIGHYLLLLGIGLGATMLVLDSSIQSVEGTFSLRTLVPFLLAISLAGIVGTTIRLWDIWLQTRQLLIALDSLPLRRSFKRLEGYTWKPFWRFGLVSMSEFRRILASQGEALTFAINASNVEGRIGTAVKSRIQALRLSHQAAVSIEQPFGRNCRQRRGLEVQLIKDFSLYQGTIAEIAGRALDELATLWGRAGKEPPYDAGSNKAKVRAWERFICLGYVGFFLAVLVRIRSMIAAIGGMYILILLALTSYPFHPKAMVDALLVVLFGYIAFVVTLVFAQIHRNATLSHITDTNPGELGTDFWIRTASFVALPLLSLLVAQFPLFNRAFYSWLEPALKALHK